MIYIVECEIKKTTSQVVRAYIEADNKKQVRKLVEEDGILNVGDIFDEDLEEDVSHKEKVLSIEEDEEV